ncbi:MULTISPECIES: Pycsar system effector family protein [Tenacibaculum]|uniref:Pycsar system effector family protein n=1 Tax=Tenacibaculum TaxID=104267 RepID=UPI0008950EE4|nr:MULTISPECIES: Pycsar system effector family protein [unclassified Tenacibaculum]RBW55217.1 HD domain-containing protein [Tenacibaculum sp. E3R01]SEE21722.1 Predicted metal-dependent phosphohydrolase, HD superfamily [Tenacibaculum sp. MAR_2010_89]
MSNLLEKVESYVINFLNAGLKKKFVYHNIAHTQRVVEKSKELAELELLDERDTEILLTAAWFHDTGYTVDLNNHEEESVKIASEFLKKEGGEEIIDEVTRIILATKMGVVPNSLLEKIVRDADCSHLGSKNYEEFSELLRKELELTKGLEFSDIDWLTNNINFLTQDHKYYSVKAIKTWEKQKGKNLAQLLKGLKKTKQELAKIKQKKEELAIKKNKIDLPERGIETMFRVALRNHITLSDIADTKANILLSVNAIIISMTLSTLIPKLDNPSNSYLLVPSIIFIIFTVISIILSILATRPNVTEGKFSKEDVANKKVNLIFFGNFHKMSLPEFEWAMDEMLKDRDYLYGSLTKDLYFLGLVLNRKYSILRTTYTVFMIGIIVSVISFAIAFYMQSGAAAV